MNKFFVESKWLYSLLYDNVNSVYIRIPLNLAPTKKYFILYQSITTTNLFSHVSIELTTKSISCARNKYQYYIIIILLNEKSDNSV